MKLKKFYKNIQQKKIKYFFNSQGIYEEVFKTLNKLKTKQIESILEIGCGDMRSLYLFNSLKYKSYTGIDWIDFKKKIKDSRIKFKKASIENLKIEELYNVVLMIGTLEHFTNPWSIISKIKKNMLKNSKFIFTVPNYINPRGLVLLTIKELFNKKISKSDIFFFTPDIIKKELKKLKFKNITIKTIKSDETYGDIAFQDLKQRLPKVLGNNKLMKINSLLKYFKIYSKTYLKNDYSGRIFFVQAQKK